MSLTNTATVWQVSFSVPQRKRAAVDGEHCGVVDQLDGWQAGNVGREACGRGSGEQADVENARSCSGRRCSDRRCGEAVECRVVIVREAISPSILLGRCSGRAGRHGECGKDEREHSQARDLESSNPNLRATRAYKDPHTYKASSVLVRVPCMGMGRSTHGSLLRDKKPEIN